MFFQTASAAQAGKGRLKTGMRCRAPARTAFSDGLSVS